MQITSRLTMAAHMVCAIDYFSDSRPVTSTFLAGSLGTSPVMVRTIMSMLKKAGIIVSSKGKSGIEVARTIAALDSKTRGCTSKGRFNPPPRPRGACPCPA